MERTAITTSGQPGSLTTWPAPACPKCVDQGYTGWKTPDGGYPFNECQVCDCATGQSELAYWSKRADRAKMQRLRALFSGAEIPAHFQNLTIETMIERAGQDKGKKAAIRAAQLFCEVGYLSDPASKRYKTGLVFTGAFGTGKTGLLTPVLRHFVAQGKSGLWIEFYDLITAIQREYGAKPDENGDRATGKLEAAQRADVILLDDLGDLGLVNDKGQIAPEKDDRRRILYQLINYRHNAGLPMLITTNLSQGQMADQFGARVCERLLESCAWVNVAGANLRSN